MNLQKIDFAFFNFANWPQHGVPAIHLIIAVSNFASKAKR